jgi:putative tryptophan/tyrosine transport system substrate-binding protein
LGYVEGRNLKVEDRFAFNPETLHVLAAELVAQGPDAIITVCKPPAIALKRATTTIPIVMTTNDTPRTGVVANLAHPGGNITGVSEYGSEVVGKRMEVLKEVASGSRLAFAGFRRSSTSRLAS